MTSPVPPLVSIVTPAFNAARYLPDLLQSVAIQDYPRIEHIVIDDGSTDAGATVALLEQCPRVRWWTRGNRGQYATLNEGFRAATGEFITTISADDVYLDAGAVGALAAWLIEHPDCDAAYGLTRHVDDHLVPLPVQPFQRHPAWMLRYKLGFVFHCSLLVRRDRLLRDGLFFDESLRYIGDAEWMARMVGAGYRFGRVDREIAAYRHHASQASSVAVADAAADARRNAEHAAVAARLSRHAMLVRMVEWYDVIQQRRVKLIAALRSGGPRAAARLAGDWIRRRGRRAR